MSAGADDRGSDAQIMLFVTFVWIVCTIAFRFIEMKMPDAEIAWTAGIRVFLLMTGGIWMADSHGKQD